MFRYLVIFPLEAEIIMAVARKGYFRQSNKIRDGILVKCLM